MPIVFVFRRWVDAHVYRLLLPSPSSQLGYMHGIRLQVVFAVDTLLHARVRIVVHKLL